MDALIIFLFWAFVFWVCWKWFLRDWFNGLSATKVAKSQFAARQISDEDYFEMAAIEVQDNQIRPGLWAKAWSEAGGDDTKAKALYLKLRVATMRNETAKYIMTGMSPNKAIDTGGAKTIVACPHCNRNLRVDSGKHLSVTCPLCNGLFETQT